MEPRAVTTSNDARQIVAERDLDYVKLGLFDVDGILRGKYMARDKFFSSLEGGFGFCDVVLGWDANDQLYDNTRLTGWHKGYGDAQVRILPESCRELPFEEPMLLFLCEFAPPLETICPRGVLRRVLDHGRAMGCAPCAAFEYEFFVFAETPHSVRAKGYRDLQPLAPGHFGYSILRQTVHAEFYRALLSTCARMDFPLEGLHEETGPGVMEAAIRVDEALAAADKAALFKVFAKVLAERQNLMASFMAKWSPDWPGSGGHMHLSLRTLKGEPLFHEVAQPLAMSPTLRHFIAGQQRFLPELLALIAPTINAYRRFIPGYWAPTDASWGVDNRTVGLRFVPGSPKSQRLECRLAAADANPYLALAAALAAGLSGVEQRLEPDPPVEGNAYQRPAPEPLALPRTLWEAAQRLKTSAVARAWFGPDFVDHYAVTREWEERQFRKHISRWELERYFEII